MRARSALLWATLLTAIGGPTAAQDRGMVLLEEAAARYAPVSTLCADFVMHLLVPLLDDESTGRGRLCQARPNLFAMRFTDPANDLILVDGSSFWYYMPSNDPKWQEVATKLDLAKAYEEMGDKDGARELLGEVMKDGDAAQKGQAQQILTKLG